MCSRKYFQNAPFFREIGNDHAYTLVCKSDATGLTGSGGYLNNFLKVCTVQVFKTSPELFFCFCFCFVYLFIFFAQNWGLGNKFLWKFVFSRAKSKLKSMKIWLENAILLQKIHVGAWSWKGAWNGASPLEWKMAWKMGVLKAAHTCTTFQCNCPPPRHHQIIFLFLCKEIHHFHAKKRLPAKHG